MTKTPSEASSLTESAYSRLRTHLVTGAVRPGDRLKISALAQWLEVSPGAVREALARLSAEGLVSATPQRGFRVASMSAEELRDITRVRIEIEVLCLKRSMELGDLGWESRVVGAYHALGRAPVNATQGHAAPTVPWANAHAHFHRELLAACDSPWLLRLREQIYVQGERYRLAAIGFIPRERSLEDEHEQLLKAVLARDTDAAATLMAHHFGQTAEQMLKFSANTWG